MFHVRALVDPTTERPVAGPIHWHSVVSTPFKLVCQCRTTQLQLVVREAKVGFVDELALLRASNLSFNSS
jgi:hypothetical protein